MEFLAVSLSTARKFGEIGFLVGAVGALLLVLDGARPSSQSGRNLTRVIGAVLIAVGFVLGILYVHSI